MLPRSDCRSVHRSAEPIRRRRRQRLPEGDARRDYLPVRVPFLANPLFFRLAALTPSRPTVSSPYCPIRQPTSSRRAGRLTASRIAWRSSSLRCRVVRSPVEPPLKEQQETRFSIVVRLRHPRCLESLDEFLIRHDRVYDAGVSPYLATCRPIEPRASFSLTETLARIWILDWAGSPQ